MSFVKLRGLPWSCSKRDVMQFLAGCRIKEKEQIEPDEIKEDLNTFAIYFLHSQEGRPTGEAFVELCGEKELELALTRHNRLIGHRYIEVFRSNEEQFEKHVLESVHNTKNWSSPVVRLRGLPYRCTKQNIIEFFAGLPLRYDNVLMVIGFCGKFKGEAFVKFENMDHAHLALNKHKNKMCDRYIEVFRSTLESMSTYSTLSDSNKSSQRIVNNRHSLKRKSSSSSSSSSNSNCLLETPTASLGDYDSANMRNKRIKSHVRNEQTSDCLAYIENMKSLPSLMSKQIEAPANLALKSEPVACMLKEQERNLKTQFGVKMRGLPYSATESDVRRFFSPLQPVKIVILTGKFGECECYFQTSKEADEAMKYHKNYMSNRYIELFKMPSAEMAFTKTKSANGSSPNKANFSRRSPKNETTSQNQIESQNKRTNVNRANCSSQFPNQPPLNQFSPIQLLSNLAEQQSNETPIKQKCNIYDNSLCDTIRKAHSTPNLTSPLNSNQLLRTHAPLNLTLNLSTNMNNKFISDLLKLYCLQQNLHSQSLQFNANNQ